MVIVQTITQIENPVVLSLGRTGIRHTEDEIVVGFAGFHEPVYQGCKVPVIHAVPEHTNRRDASPDSYF